MSFHRFIAVMSVTWVVCQPTSAEACSCLNAPGISTSVPRHGDTDVPLNVVPWVVAGGALELRDARGDVVPVEAKPVSPIGFECLGATELVPADPLLPNTQYTIAVSEESVRQGEEEGVGLQGSAAVTFTTGTQALALNEAIAPDTSFFAMDAIGQSNSCVSGPIQACLWTEAQGLLEVRLMNGEQEVSRYLSQALPEMSFVLGSPGQIDCVELRTRDVAGQLSQPTKYCFDDTQLPKVNRTDPGSGLLIDCTTTVKRAELNELPAADDETPTDTDAGIAQPPEEETAAEDAGSATSPEEETEAVNDVGTAPSDETTTANDVASAPLPEGAAEAVDDVGTAPSREEETTAAGDVASAAPPGVASAEPTESKGAVKETSNDEIGCSLRTTSSRSGAGVWGSVVFVALGAVLVRGRYVR